MNKSALVIGGTGFLGTAIVEELISSGFLVTALARGQKPRKVDAAKFIQSDRSAMAEVLRTQSFDLVVDCCAYKPPEAQGAIDALADRVGHYFFISTDFVYRAESNLRFPLNEDAPKQINAPYGVGKLQCEQLLIGAFNEKRFPATILRPPHILGFGKELGCDFSQMREPKILEFIRSGEGATLTDNGQLLIQPVHHREIGAVIAALCGNVRAIGQIFNITGPDCVTTRHYYEIVAEQFGVPLRYCSVSMDELLVKKPDLAPIARHRIYDLSRLTNITGYTPKFGLKESLVETIRWMESRGGA